ncbi:iron chaperone [Microbacterium terricola]|uniref:YdhG-like domain-containing protein n=1 Tax=Microbacterium terricola TaxID=344163 RepID=A0ABM8DXV7_9MICO|nr:DUF1801 domain-containing protein [Microbacterium terricola]UYK38798.1 DUF1801 domain-containing protein [Microbacterium terricola]BDV30508.1 hypothetical protein Microterr_11680 [Microbacterium terricola]
MSAPEVDTYIAGFPPEVAARLQRIREIILGRVPGAEEKMRYGIAAVMLGGRYALHYAGWKKHIGLYPVPTLSAGLEARVAPYRSEKDSVAFLHRDPLPFDLVDEIAAEVSALRGS